MELKELYNFYKTHVPLMAQNIMTLRTKQVEEIRESIIKIHRSVSLIPFLNTKTAFKNEIPEKSERLNYVFREAIVSPPHVSPQLLQQCSHLYLFLQQYPSDLFDGLISVKGTPLYYFVIHSSLPSLYGFFSSQEHVQLAFPFYAHALLYPDRKVGTEIMLPFFNTPSTYRFIEKVMAPICDRIVADKKLKGESSSVNVLKIYSLYLMELIAESAPLLSQSTFLILMKQHWGIKGSKNFILNDFVKLFAHSWLSANGLDSSIPFIDSVITYLYDDEVNSSALISKITDSRCLNEMPSMFTAFNLQYYLYLITLQDYLSLIKVMSVKRELPASISTNFQTKPAHAAFWVKIFPKRKIPKAQRNRPIVFTQHEAINVEMDADIDRIWRRIKSDADDARQIPYDYINDNKKFNNLSPKLKEVTLENSIIALQETGEAFEDLMQLLHNYRELQHWKEIAELHLKLVSAQIINNEMIFLAQKSDYRHMNRIFIK